MNENKSVRSLTPHQKDAVNLVDRSVCVSACAGSGKTTVLVERYAGLVLDHGVDPDRILAITFSDQAAHNMRLRLIERFHTADCPIRTRQLEGAHIATIHSFGKTVLTEYPFEVGIAPAARVMDAGEAHLLKEKARAAVLAEVSDNELALLSDYDYQFIAEQVQRLHDVMRTHGIDPVTFMVQPSDPKAARSIKTALIKIVQEMLTAAPFEKRVFTQKRVALLEELAGKLQGEGGELLSDENFVFYVTTMEGMTSSSASQTEIFETCRHLMALYIGLYVEERAQPRKESLRGLIERFAKTYAGFKADRKLLDFDDLLCHVAELLTSEGPIRGAVTARLRKQFDYILVDEYQDTNALQARIIEALAKEHNLFVVGDVRQSIYGFRGADVTVMQEKEKVFAADERKKVIPLEDTHRSTQTITAFVNGLFAHLEALTGKGGFKGIRSSIAAGPYDHPAEILVTPFGHADDETIDVARIKEAACLAKRIKELVATKTLVREKDNTVRPVRYADIAILFRTMTNVAVFERCLRAEDVPYYVIKGGAFYQSAEITDIIMLLTVVERPYDDLALAAVLRSPLCGISHDALFWLGQFEKDNKEWPFYHKVRKFRAIKELAKGDEEKIARFLGIYDQLRGRKDHVTIEDLTVSLLGMTEYEFKVLLMKEGERKYANIEKLKEIVKAYDINENGTLSEFLHYISALTRLEVQEQEASLESETDNTVKIFTVHRAKGSEYPVVCVADMGSRRKQQGEGKFTFSREQGLGLALYFSEHALTVDDRTNILNKMSRSVAEEEEDLRVLYVALTRARDRLMLSGSVRLTKNKKKRTRLSARWIDLVLHYLEVDPGTSAADETVALNEQRAIVRINQATLSGSRMAFDTKERDIDLERGLKDLPALKMNDAALLKQVQDNIAALEIPRVRERRFSVTELVTYSVCPRLYYLRHETALPSLLLPERAQEQKKPSGEKAEGRSDRVIGTVFHELAEKADLMALDEKALFKEARYYLDRLNKGQRDLLQRCITSLCSDKFAKELALDRVRSYYTEVPIVASADGATLNGQIDVVFQYDDSITILDYKTSMNRQGNEIDDEYWMQMRLYALMYSKAVPGVRVKTIVFFPHTNSYYERSFTIEELAAFERLLATDIKKIVSYEFEQKHIEHCSYCEFCDCCSTAQ
jgi:ATP-dependent helicase/nuclease subunit A